MITLEVIQRIWTLIPTPAQGGCVEARDLEIGAANDNPRLTISAEGYRHLLIPMAVGERLAQDTRSSGVQLLCSEWGEGEQRRQFVDLVCLKPHLNEVFDLIIYDVLSEVMKKKTRADYACLVVLNRWRELLAQEAGLTLSKNTAIGLLGELTVLRELVRMNPLALKAWTGPEKGRFDFFSGGTAIEVKSSLKRQGTILSIHGHDQLDPPQAGNLHLIVLQFEETPAAGENLGDIIHSLVDLGVSRAEIHTKLAGLRVLPESIAAAEEMRFRLVDQRVYLVDSSFPRITSTSFVGSSLPFGVISLDYQIDLSAPPPHPLSAADAEAALKQLAEKIQ